AILLLLLACWHQVAPPEDRITEVSLLESGPADTPAPPAAAAPAAPAPRTEVGSLREQRTEHAFRRVESGDPAPDAHAANAVQDRLNARLATLQSNDSPALAGLSSLAPSMPQLAKAAGIDGGTGTGPAMALHRAPQGDGGGGSAPLALVRGGGGGGADIALAALPAEHASRDSGPPPQALPRKSLAGMSLARPLADPAL